MLGFYFKRAQKRTWRAKAKTAGVLSAAAAALIAGTALTAGSASAQLDRTWPADADIIWPSDKKLPVCITGDLAYHDHPTFWVVVQHANGVPQVLTPPKDIGIQRHPKEERCFREIHTHDNSGRLHVESVIKNRRYQLRHFLALWASEEPEKVKLIREKAAEVTYFDDDKDTGTAVKPSELGNIRLIDDRRILVIVKP